MNNPRFKLSLAFGLFFLLNPVYASDSLSSAEDEVNAAITRAVLADLASNQADEDIARADYSYSVNFMWINSRLNPEQTSLFPNQSVSNIISTLLEWSSLNQRASINVWFDSLYCVEGALIDTQTLLDAQSALLKNIHFRDIRSLQTVKDNPEVFSEALPVYFRVDLARAVFLYEMMLANETTYAAYADIDMAPMLEDELLDAETRKTLNKFGIVMAEATTAHGFENGFQIVSSSSPTLLEALKIGLIDTSIARGSVALDLQYYPHPSGGIGNTPMAGLHQTVYDSYPDMLIIYYAMRDDLGGRLLGSQGEVPVTLEQLILECKEIGYDRRGPYYLNRYCRLDVDEADAKRYYSEFSTLLLFCKIMCPTKAVQLPPAGLEYDDGV